MRLTICSHEGDTVLETPTRTVEEIREEFEKIVGQGRLAYEKTPGGNQAIREFNPDAEEIVVTPALVGG